MLADRVGIIDHGRIVAEGTPDELKAQIGRSSVEAIPAKPADPRRDRACHGALRRASPARVRRAWPFASTGGSESPGRRGPRARRRRALPLAHLQLHAPSPRRRLPGQDRPLARGCRLRGGRGGAPSRFRRAPQPAGAQVYLIARRSVRAHAAPARP